MELYTLAIETGGHKITQSATLQADRTQTELVFTASSGVVSTNFNGGTQRPGSATGAGAVVGPDNLVTHTADEITWLRPLSARYNYESLIVKRPAADFVYLNFTSESSLGTPAADGTGQDRDDRYFVFGSRTVTSDVPHTGISTYHALAYTTATSDSGSGMAGNAGSLRIDHAAGLIAGTITLTSIGTNGPSEEVVFVVSGTVGSDGLKGSIVSADNRYIGNFAGDLFGPSGVEVGLAFVLTRPDGFRVIGTLAARRN